MPKLVGLPLAEARILLEQYGLILGAQIPSAGVTNLESAFIYRQNPQPKTPDGVQIRIRPGQMVDVWVQLDPPVEDSVNIPPPPPNQQIPQ
jgi:hypothetical protein